MGPPRRVQDELAHPLHARRHTPPIDRAPQRLRASPRTRGAPLGGSGPAAQAPPQRALAQPPRQPPRKLVPCCGCWGRRGGRACVDGEGVATGSCASGVCCRCHCHGCCSRDVDTASESALLHEWLESTASRWNFAEVQGGGEPDQPAKIDTLEGSCALREGPLQAPCTKFSEAEAKTPAIGSLFLPALHSSECGPASFTTKQHVQASTTYAHPAPRAPAATHLQSPGSQRHSPLDAAQPLS